MSHEIVYTSAAAGLKTGSKGFCTVISTEGLTDYLSERLEMLSGYRHAFSPGDPQAPVNYSHLKIKVGRHEYHVLSRVCDAGFDYSQRSNKLAHHVALENNELIPAGPAAVLAAPGFCITRWDGTTKMLSDGRRPPAHVVPTGTCRTWESIAADAGWAGVLAETATSRRPKPVSIIFQPGTDTLSLVGESLSLLSSQQRWNVSFSTYYTKAVAGSECLWQFVLDGTKQAEDLRARKIGKIIDLSSRLPQASGGSLVHVARNGKQASDPTQTMPPLPGGKAWPTRSPRVEVAEETDTAYDDFDSRDPFQGIPELPASHRGKSNKLSRTQRQLAIGGIILVAAAGAIVAGAYFSSRQRAQQNQFQLELPNRNDLPEPPKSESNGAPSDARTEDRETLTTPEAGIDQANTEDKQTASENLSGQSEGDFPLLDLPFSTGTASIPLGAEYSRRCQLTLLGAAQFLNNTVRLTKQTNVAAGEQEWLLTWKYPDASSPGSLGTFTVGDGTLTFNRDTTTAAREYEQFRNCLLKVRSGSNELIMAMRPPHRVDAQAIDFNSGKREPLRYLLPPGISRSMTRSLRINLALADEMPVSEASADPDESDAPSASTNDDSGPVSSVALIQFPDGELRNLQPDRRIALAIDREGRMSSMQKIGRRRPSVTGRRDAGSEQNLAEIDLSLTVEAGPRDTNTGRSSRVIAIKLTPEISIRRLKTVGRDFAHKFLTGDEQLLAPARSIPWSANAIEKELSEKRLLREIVEPVIRQYNHKVPGPPLLEVVELATLDTVHNEIGKYYNEFALADENDASERLGRLIAAVKFKDEKRRILTTTTDQLQGRLLNLNAWLMIEGQRVPVLTTRAEQ